MSRISQLCGAMETIKKCRRQLHNLDKNHLKDGPAEQVLREIEEELLATQPVPQLLQLPQAVVETLYRWLNHVPHEELTSDAAYALIFVRDYLASKQVGT